jgi:competence protein ComEA
MRIILICGAVLCVWAALCATPSQVKQQLPDGPGKDPFKRVCSQCHGPEIVIGKGRTLEEWGDLVVKMVEKGAKGTEDDFNDAVDYLAKNFPPPPKIQVNKATAKDLENGLDLSAKEAEAIVRYREAKGDFKSTEDLKKVPGIDSKKIEEKKNRLLF